MDLGSKLLPSQSVFWQVTSLQAKRGVSRRLRLAGNEGENGGGEFVRDQQEAALVEADNAFPIAGVAFVAELEGNGR